MKPTLKQLASLGLCLSVFAIAGCAQTTQAQTINLHQPVWAADLYEQGSAAWDNGDSQSAVRHFKDAYTFSDARAEAMLGILYLRGAGVFQSAEVARAYAIAADQRSDFDAFTFYKNRWDERGEADSAYLIAWVLANRFSGRARSDYEHWIKLAARANHAEAKKDIAQFIN